MSSVKMPNMDQKRAEVTADNTATIMQTGTTIQQGGNFVGSAVESLCDNPVLGAQIKEATQIAGQVIQTTGQVYSATQSSDGSLKSAMGAVTDTGRATLDIAGQVTGENAFTAKGQTQIYQAKVKEADEEIEGLQMELSSARNERHSARVQEKLTKVQEERAQYAQHVPASAEE